MGEETTLNQYQEEAAKTAIYSEDYRVLYPVLGLANEAGEVAGKLKKIMRDWGHHNPNPTQKKELASELGDVLWYLAQTATDLGISLEEIAVKNLAKLLSRQERDKLTGSGDQR